MLCEKCGHPARFDDWYDTDLGQVRGYICENENCGAVSYENPQARQANLTRNSQPDQFLENYWMVPLSNAQWEEPAFGGLIDVGGYSRPELMRFGVPATEPKSSLFSSEVMQEFLRKFEIKPDGTISQRPEEKDKPDEA